MPPTPLSIGIGQTDTISSSGSYAPVSFVAAGTLDVIGNGVTAALGSITATALDVFNVSGGATLDLTGFVGISALDTYNIGNNGALEVGTGINVDLLSAINFVNTGGTAATLIIGQGESLDLLSGGINTWAAGDNIELAGSTITGVSWVQKSFGVPLPGGVLTIDTTTGTETVTINAGTYTTANFKIIDGNDVSFACFVEGTGIDTEVGAIAVENLREGDVVLLASGGKRPVKWIGWRSIDIARHPDPERVLPIRVVANAIADGMPRLDVLMSPDHALFIDGKLIPVRLLRNGATIREETGCQTVTYYHVELDAHDVLLAQGLATESYLDTGNRAAFENAGVPVLLHADFDGSAGQARREAESCAPLVCGQADVEPVWHTLADRAQVLGFSLMAPTTTDDPALSITAGGMRIWPISREGGRYTFVLPTFHGEARLSSRHASPSTAMPWMEDRRQLGVMVRQIIVRSADDYAVMAMDDPGQTDGWWAAERDIVTIWRWTNGSAVLPIGRGPAVVEVIIGDTVPYPIGCFNPCGSQIAGRAARCLTDQYGRKEPAIAGLYRDPTQVFSLGGGLWFIEGRLEDKDRRRVVRRPRQISRQKRECVRERFDA